MDPLKLDLSQIPVFRMLMSPSAAQDTEVFNPAAFDELYKGWGGVEKNSLTTTPAIRLKAVLQSSGVQQLKLMDSPDTSKRMITGVKMVPGMFLLKVNEEGQPYADVYTQEVIYHSRNKFMMKENIHGIDLEHLGPNMSDMFLVESWLVEDSTNDKLNSLGFREQFQALGYDNIPVGTWAVTYFVPNDSLWNEIMTNPDGYGFSIKGYFGGLRMNADKNDRALAQAIELSKRDDMSIEEKAAALLSFLKD